MNKEFLQEDKYVDPRHSMAFLPRLIQPFLTWLTAKPLSANDFHISKNGLYQVVTAWLSLIMGVSLSYLFFARGLYFFILFTSLITVSGMRKLQVVIFHHCAHGTIFKNKLSHFLLGEVISIILLIKDFRTYKKDHLAHHNATKLLTMQDETFQDLAEINIVPGVKKKILWQRLLMSCASPFAHARWLLNRVKLSILSPYVDHNLVAIFYWTLLYLVLSKHHLMLAFLVVWLIPMTVPYHISRILRLAAEHRFPKIKLNKSTSKTFICLSTIAVFNGESAPTFIRDIEAWINWIFRMIFIHLFFRIFVLVGDTPCHDYHHRRPHSRNWPNYAYARQKDAENGCPGYPINYAEEWGLINAIDKNFEALYQLKNNQGYDACFGL